MRGPRRARFFLALASLLTGLLASELVLRVRAAGSVRAGLEDVSTSARFEPPQGREVRLGDIIRPSAHPGVVYELLPDLRTTFHGKRLATNSAGFRGPDVPLEKPPGTVRILGLGDSVQFGWAVGEGVNYLAQLVRLLNERHPDVRWEAIHTAVPGYNTSMQAAVLEARGLDYDPDLVLVGFVRNDLFLPNFLLEQPDPWATDRSYLLDLFTGAARSAPSLVGRPTKGNDPGDVLVPPAYRGTIGLAGYRSAMERIASLRDERGFEVVVFCEEAVEPNAGVAGIREELGIPLVSSDELVAAHLEERGVGSREDAGLTVSRTDPHPSRAGHELIAEALVEALSEHSLLELLAARARR